MKFNNMIPISAFERTQIEHSYLACTSILIQLRLGSLWRYTKLRMINCIITLHNIQQSNVNCYIGCVTTNKFWIVS